jgi:hypothetical protein
VFPPESVPAIEAACIKVTIRVFRCLDTRDHRGATDMFAPDGTWKRARGNDLTGHAAILADLDSRPANRATAHLLSNMWAEAIDPDHARVHFYLTLRERVERPGEPAAHRAGGVLYGIDEYVRLPAGWRIQKKSTQQVLPSAETEKA